MPEQILDVVAQLMEAWNSHDLDLALALYSPEYEGLDVGEPGSRFGLQGIRDSIVRYLRAFPDLHFTEEETVAEGDHVVLVWRARGTHLGALMNIPPTGRRVAARGMSLLTIQNGKIARGLCVWDVAGLLRDLGLLPEL